MASRVNRILEEEQKVRDTVSTIGADNISDLAENYSRYNFLTMQALGKLEGERFL